MGKWLILILLLRAFTRHGQAETVITAPQGQPFWLDGGDEDDSKSWSEPDMVDWLGHPCRRTCVDDEPPMECRYSFHVEHYFAMSKACYGCPKNITDCFRPHCIPADGMRRSLVVVNRQMPGPSIEVCEGDKVIVDVTNMLHGDGTTIHWHGQHMRKTPYMDGTPWVSQCPIPAGDTFRYSFIAENPGTHFWHSHVGFQRGDGLFGPMVVKRSPKRNQLNGLYDKDEHIFLISDWDHEMGLDKFLGHYHASLDNKPPNILVNGLGRFEVRDEENSQTEIMPTAVFTVKQDLRYRFRIMNAEFLNCPIEMSIDNHTLLIVSSDGKDLEPVEAKSLVTYAGERFDVIIKMNQTIDNYWIRLRGLIDCGPQFTKAYQVAILRYEGAPEEDPQADVAYELPSIDELSLQINALNKGTEDESILSVPSLKALDNDTEANTRDPDYQFYISYDFYAKDNHDYHRKKLYGYDQVKLKVGTPQLNHISMKMPTFPLMSQTELIDSSSFCNSSTVTGCETNYCNCPHVLQVKLGSVVELVLVDEGVPYDANHPFHLHGHDFRVLAMERLGKNTTVEDVKRADREGRIKRNLKRAPIKDTVTVPDGGFTILRFHASNPGYWLFHCHIEFHSEVGMSLVFKIGEHEDFAPVPEDFPRCGNYRPKAPWRTTTTTTTTTTTSKSISTSTTSKNDPTENEVDPRQVIETWLPLIISELKAANSATTILFQPIACLCSLIMLSFVL
ncbi:hypothetical protein QAD02_001001 [Eretmocerus hayati]|uniref:Uncharacterized protein n=1 Tax=Eretmocerus hayati TaxID=131215 RepID=A0ACC2NF64_9HYME|nr:hypothetical protein QAD02_001001 [Eretmocerus hayati]